MSDNISSTKYIPPTVFDGDLKDQVVVYTTKDGTIYRMENGVFQEAKRDKEIENSEEV